MSLNYTQACTLRDLLLEHRTFSEFHSVPMAQAAVDLIHAAGLAAAYIPLAVTTRNAKSPKYEMHLAVVDPQPNNTLILNSEKSQGSATKVHSLTKLKPMTDYVGSLSEVRLDRLWWAAPHFFWDMSYALADWNCDETGESRSSWGAQYRAAFAAAFEQQWTPERVICPSTEVKPLKVRFTQIPILAPANAGDSE